MRRVAIVLCGGLSSRMGRPKAWLPWFGRTMVEHVVQRLRGAAEEIVVVTSRELDLPPLEARVIRDREPERGPLAGLRDGLAAAEGDFAFVTATDAPFLSASHVSSLLDRAAPVAPRAAGHVQVLSAVYPTTAWKEADALLERGRGRPLELLERLGFDAIDWEPGAEPAPWEGFNTPSEYLSLARRTRPDAVAMVEVLGRSALDLAETRFRVPIGTLGEVLGRLERRLPMRLLADGGLSKSHLVCLGGRELVRDLSLPVGPGERISVLDALSGG